MELEKLNKILEYQKIDMEFYRMEKEYSQSDELKRLHRCIKAFEEKKNALGQLNRDLDGVFAQLAVLDGKLDAVQSSKDIGKFDITAKDELGEVIELEKEFAKYEDEVNNLGKEINKLIKKISDVSFDNKRLNEEMQSINADSKKLKIALEQKKKTVLVKAKPIIDKLRVLIPDLDKKLYEKYTELRKGKKMPAFVLYNEGSCGGCGMDISIEVKAKMVNNGDVAECPHCGRVVYKKN